MEMTPVIHSDILQQN